MQGKSLLIINTLGSHSLFVDVDTFLETATEQLIEGQSFDNIYNYLGNLREKGGGQRNNLWTAAGSYCSADIQTSCES